MLNRIPLPFPRRQRRSFTKRIEMLMARVKEAQEREIPELAERLAAVEAFQAIGDEVRDLFRVRGNDGVSCSRGQHVFVSSFPRGCGEGYLLPSFCRATAAVVAADAVASAAAGAAAAAAATAAAAAATTVSRLHSLGCLSMDAMGRRSPFTTPRFK